MKRSIARSIIAIAAVAATVISSAASADPTVPSLFDIRRIRAEAFRGNAQAQFDLAVLYEEGRGGIKRDLAYALSWYEEAARNGLRLAREKLARLSHEE